MRAVSERDGKSKQAAQRRRVTGTFNILSIVIISGGTGNPSKEHEGSHYDSHPNSTASTKDQHQLAAVKPFALRMTAVIPVQGSVHGAPCPAEGVTTRLDPR